MKIAIASDHAGFPLKSEIITYLKEQKVDVIDLGNEGTGSVDYPDFAEKVAVSVSQGKADAGILICGTGIGMSITANKFKGVRAAVVSDLVSAQTSKEHNNANILCFGARILDPQKARQIVRAWHEAKYAGGRHENRLKKIQEIEKKNFC